MRITNFEKSTMTDHYMKSLQSLMAKQQQQLSSGKVIQKASDNPVKMNRSMVIDENMAGIEQYKKNIVDAEGFLKTAETHLNTTLDAVTEIREIALRASNDTYSSDDREIFANLVEENIKHIVGIANSKYLGKQLFSGEQTGMESITYNGTTAVYNGDGSPKEIEVSSQMKIEVSLTADVAFKGLIDSLISLRDEIRTGDASTINVAIGSLDSESENVVNLRSELGVRNRTTEVLTESYEQLKLDFEQKKQLNEEVDFTKIISEYTRTQQIYQATIQSSLKMMENSILNYI